MLNTVYFVLVCLIFVVSAWSLYNLPILVAGIKNLRTSKPKVPRRSACKKDLPFFSLVVPMKDEEKVAVRLIDSLSKLNYPADKKEVILVEDASTDRTYDVCLEAAEKLGADVKVYHRDSSDGKPSALNYGVARARGDIIGVFDADSILAGDVLLNVCKYFEDPRVAAVQGRILGINSEESMLAKFNSYEEAVWCEAYQRGKDALSLFVNLSGNCQFIRRTVLERVKGFDEAALTEDIEISARLTEKGYQIRYAPDVKSWQENPSCLKQLFRQRTRWYRGWMEVAFRYGRLMARPNRIGMDAEVTLLGPFMLILSLVTYLATIFAILMPPASNVFWQFTVQFTLAGTTLLICLCGLILIYISKPRNLKNLLWLPFIYGYYCIQVFIALHAGFQILLRRPRRWLKTERSGVVADAEFSQSPQQTQSTE